MCIAQFINVTDDAVGRDSNGKPGAGLKPARTCSG